MSSARHIIEQLGGRWRGRSGTCKCPAHDDSTPSMSVSETRDGRPLVHCHANCSQAVLIDALRARGLWDGAAKTDPSYPGYLTRPHDGHTNRDDRERQQFARDLWDRSNRINGTIVVRYLQSRGINLTSWPDALGHFPLLEHKPSRRAFPAMIARVTDNRGQTLAVQRTWLAPDGSGKAPVDMQKMTVGPMGRGAVRFGAGDLIGIAEGVETALSAKMIYQIPVWATLSANRLDKIALPDEVESVVIFADHGKVGMDAALSAARTYEHQGKAVDVMPPRVHFGDTPNDFNDALRAGV